MNLQLVIWYVTIRIIIVLHSQCLLIFIRQQLEFQLMSEQRQFLPCSILRLALNTLDDLVTYSLRYVEGGVLRRAGHTEATVDLPKMAGLYPAGVIY